jgi:hypothetical protein
LLSDSRATPCLSLEAHHWHYVVIPARPAARTPLPTREPCLAATAPCLSLPRCVPLVLHGPDGGKEVVGRICTNAAIGQPAVLCGPDGGDGRSPCGGSGVDLAELLEAPAQACASGCEGQPNALPVSVGQQRLLEQAEKPFAAAAAVMPSVCGGQSSAAAGVGPATPLAGATDALPAAGCTGSASGSYDGSISGGSSSPVKGSCGCPLAACSISPPRRGQ